MFRIVLETDRERLPDLIVSTRLACSAQNQLFSIAHFDAPLPVCVAIQPGGGAPVFDIVEIDCLSDGQSCCHDNRHYR